MTKDASPWRRGCGSSEGGRTAFNVAPAQFPHQCRAENGGSVPGSAGNVHRYRRKPVWRRSELIPEAAAETKAAATRRRRRRGGLTEHGGIPARRQQTPETRIYYNREAAAVQHRLIAQRLQPSLHRLGQLHFAERASHVTHQLIRRVQQNEEQEGERAAAAEASG